MSLPEWSLNRPVTTIMVLISVMVLGVISITLLPVKLYPDTNYPELAVEVSYPSSSPSEIRRRIVVPIQEVMSTMPNLEKKGSYIREGGCNIWMTFKREADIHLMLMEARARLDHIRSRLPEGLTRIRVRRYARGARPILKLIVGYGGSLEDALEIGRKRFQPLLLRVEGVSEVTVRAARPEAKNRVALSLNPELLSRHRKDAGDVARAIRTGSLNRSGGILRSQGQALPVRVMGAVHSAEELGALPMGSNGLRVRDLATVDVGEDKYEEVHRIERDEMVIVEVSKNSSANLVATVQKCKNVLEQILVDANDPRISYQIYDDGSKEIENRLNDLWEAIIIGGVLVVVLIFLFIRHLPSTFVVVAAIPVSALATFGGMYLIRRFTGLEISINIISLMGFMVALGMLVDPAIVVLENIVRQRHNLGKDAGEAARAGAAGVSLALSAATMTTLCVFVPIIFFPSGWFFLWMRDFAVAVACALFAALMVSLTLVPLLSSWSLKNAPATSSPLLAWIERWYARLVTLTVRSSVTALITVAIAGGILSGSFFLWTQIERSWPRRVRPRRADVQIRFDDAVKFATRDSVLTDIYNLLDAHRDSLEIKTMVVHENMKGYSIVEVYLKEGDDALLPTAEVETRIHAMLPPAIPGAVYNHQRIRGRQRRSQELTMEVRGRRMDILAMYALEIKERISSIPLLTKVATDLELGTPELVVSVRPDVSETGRFTPRQVASTMISSLSERPSSYISLGDEELEVVLKLKGREEKFTTHELSNLPLVDDSGTTHSLASVAHFSYQPGQRRIMTQGSATVVGVTATVGAGASMKDVQEAVEKALEDMSVIPGYSWNMGRDWSYWQDGQTNQWAVIYMAIPFVYMVMAALFESFVYPLAILFAIPFGFVGVALSLYATSTMFSNYTQLGILILAGIVVNNAIVLVDYINRLRKEGMGQKEAIVTGGKHRLRPIAMTAMSTIAGLLPLAAPLLWQTLMGWSEDVISLVGMSVPDAVKYLIPPAEGRESRWPPVGMILIAGMGSSTVLTLVLLPSIYLLLDDVSLLLKRLVRSAVRRGADTTDKQAHSADVPS